MAISPISAFSNYSYLFNITSQDEKAEQKDKLNLLMSQYNLVSTDDYDKDIERLRAAIIQEQIERASQEQEKSQETEGYEERPWYEIMWKLGLTQNDSIREEYDDIRDELDYRIINSQDEDEYNAYNNMRIRAEEYFNEYSEYTTSRIDTSSSNLIGLSMLATMNMMDLNLI